MAIRTQGTCFFVNNIEIGEVKSFTGPGGSANIIDASHLKSVAREKLLGLADEGTFSVTANYLPDDLGQQEAQDKRISGEEVAVRALFADTGSTEFQFNAFVSEFTTSGGVDELVEVTISFEITGQVTRV